MIKVLVTSKSVAFECDYCYLELACYRILATCPSYFETPPCASQLFFHCLPREWSGRILLVLSLALLISICRIVKSVNFWISCPLKSEYNNKPTFRNLIYELDWCCYFMYSFFMKDWSIKLFRLIALLCSCQISCSDWHRDQFSSSSKNIQAQLKFHPKWILKIFAFFLSACKQTFICMTVVTHYTRLWSKCISFFC